MSQKQQIGKEILNELYARVYALTEYEVSYDKDRRHIMILSPLNVFYSPTLTDIFKVCEEYNLLYFFQYSTYEKRIELIIHSSKL